MKAKKFLSWEMFLLIILILEFVIFGAKNPKFLMPRVLFASVNDFIAICFIALFVTFVMITGGIDIQAASIVGLTSIIIGVGWQDGGIFDLPVTEYDVDGSICGALSGFFIAYCGVQAMVVTLGGSFLYAGFALLVSNFSASEAYQGISGFPDSFKIISKFKLFGVIPSQLLVFIVLIIIAYILLHRTKYGRSIFLVGINQEAAEYSGINTRLVILSTYVLSAVSAAFAGIMLTSYLGTAKSDLGANLTLNIITAVVLGGTLSTGGKGSVIGTALAALVIGILRFGLSLCFRVNTQYLDIPVDYDNLIEIGSMMGSGGLIVMDEDTCMVDIAKFFLEFTVDESCGKCTPCRIGTKRLYELLDKITKGKATMDDLDKLETLCYHIKENALCGLGQTAPNPVLSTLKYFRDEYIAHIQEKRCPAGVCKSLLTIQILPEKCKGCTLCARNCPTGAITGKVKEAHVIDSEKCVKCGVCIEKCRFGAIVKK